MECKRTLQDSNMMGSKDGTSIKTSYQQRNEKSLGTTLEKELL